MPNIAKSKSINRANKWEQQYTKQDSNILVCCFIVKPYLLLAYHFFIILFIFFHISFFHTKENPAQEYHSYISILKHRFQFISKILKSHWYIKSKCHQKICLNLWIITQLLTWTLHLILLISKLPQMNQHGTPYVDL